MLLTLEALNAEEGDCLLLHCGTQEEPRHVLIDGGPRGTFASSLRPRLRQLRELHELGDGESLSLALAILTHTDADHVDGLVAMLEDLRATRDRKQALPWDIQRLWYNGFDRVAGNHEVASIESLPAIAPPDVVAFVAGTKMGLALTDLTRKLYIPVNKDFADLAPNHGGKKGPFVARPSDECPGLQLDELGDLTFTVLSPTAGELAAFEKEWDRYLEQQAAKKAAGGAAAFGDDKSPTNLSSIVLLVEAADRRLLLTGDARAEHILDGLRAAGRLDGKRPYVVDLLKDQHHGSLHNSTPEFYQQVHASHYVISANGKHGNPDREVLDMIWKARGEGDWQLWVTFPRDAYQLVKPSAGKTAHEAAALEERRAALEEIQAWFDDHPVRVNYRDPDQVSIRIDLGDEKLD